MRVCSQRTAEGTHLAGRRGAAARRARPARSSARSPATSPTTSAGRRPGSSRRCSRHGRSPVTSRSGEAYVESVAPHGLAGGRARRTSSRTCRRCAAGSRRTCRPAEADRQLKLGPGGLRDVEFAVQLLQLVHGRTDALPAHAATRSTRWRRSRTGGYVGRDDAGRARRRLPLPAHARAPAPAAPAAAYARDARRRRPTCGGSAARRASASDPVDELATRVAPARARGAPPAREALLPAAARRRSRGCPATRRG